MGGSIITKILDYIFARAFISGASSILQHDIGSYMTLHGSMRAAGKMSSPEPYRIPFAIDLRPKAEGGRGGVSPKTFKQNGCMLGGRGAVSIRSQERLQSRGEGGCLC